MTTMKLDRNFFFGFFGGFTFEPSACHARR